MDLVNERDDIIMVAESGSSSDEESDAEEEREIDDDENSNASGETNVTDDSIYNRLIRDLHGDEYMLDGGITIVDTEEARVLLANIDSFCEALASKKSLALLELGADDTGFLNPTNVEINQENVIAWNKFFSALEGLETIGELYIRSFNLSAELVARVLFSTSRVVGEDGMTMSLPWRSSGDDLIPVLEAFCNLQCERTVLVMQGSSHREGEVMRNHFQEGNIFRLLCNNRWSELGLHGIEFTHDESKALAHILSTSCCSMTHFYINDCTFQNGGGELVADAFKDNTSLKSVSLLGPHGDALFCNTFLQSFPSNTSVEKLVCSNALPTNAAIVDLVKNVARWNCTLTEMQIYDYHHLTASKKQEIEAAVSQNYTLKQVSLSYSQSEPFDAILRLNEAGRRYLAEDATSCSKCIAVLAKVKHDIDCLYYHMRENPVLCIAYTRNAGEDVKKRKGVVSLDGADAMKLAQTH